MKTVIITENWLQPFIRNAYYQEKNSYKYEKMLITSEIGYNHENNVHNHKYFVTNMEK